MRSPLVRRHLSNHLLWSMFQSSATHITHYKSCWTFCVGSNIFSINIIIPIYDCCKYEIAFWFNCPRLPTPTVPTLEWRQNGKARAFFWAFSSGPHKINFNLAQISKMIFQDSSNFHYFKANIWKPFCWRNFFCFFFNEQNQIKHILVLFL